MHWLLDEGIGGGVRGGGLPLSITEIPHLARLPNVCISAKTFVCLFLSLYSAFMLKTGTQQNENKRPQRRGV